MIGTRRFGLALALVAGAFWSSLVSGDTTTWIGAVNSTGSWSQVGNWNNGLPAAGMDVAITNGSVLLEAETPSLNLFQMSGGKLIFSNWTTRLVATNINLNGGVVTLPPAFTNTVMSNRVWFVCDQNFLLGTGVVIDALGKGYIQNTGPGKGVGSGGGGYGGAGGIVGGEGGVTYGDAATPLAPGSGGGVGGTSKGGPGGGAVLIEAGGAVTVNGTIKADGSNATHTAAGGSGGSVYITCATFGGLTNGLISVAGGDGCWWAGSYYLAHGGGGGRIAIDYDTLAGNHSVRFAATPGPGLSSGPINGKLIRRGPENGTLWLPDTALLSESMGNGLFKDVRLVIPGFTAWSVNTLSVNNCSWSFEQAGFVLTVTNSLSIANGSLGIRGDVTVQNGNLELGNGGGLYVYAAPTNGVGPDYGALLQVGGDVLVALNGWLFPTAEGSNGATVLMRMQNLTIATNGGINADGRGFQDKKGPGAVGIADGAGAGHGGLGNAAGNTVGPVYGSTNNPVLPGSGGGQAIYGGFGGGAVRLAVSNAVTVHGTITANGLGNILSSAGCGSGGAIKIDCQSFGGNGLLSASGGSGTISLPTWYGGGGGGGRIAVQYTSLSSPRVIRFKTAGGLGTERNGTARAMLGARDGTLWLPNTQLLTETLIDNLFTGVRLFSPGFTSWAVDHLTVSNCSVTFPDGFALTVTNDLLIGATGKLSLVGGLLAVSQGNLRLTNGGALYVSSLATNGAPGNYGAKVDVAGDVTMGIGSWIFPTADEAGGGAVQFVMKNLNVATNAGFDADGRGYSRGRGPGGGGANTGRGGGGHGGKGSYWGTDPGGKINGLTNAPLEPGSAGGYAGGNWEQSGYGGGLVWVEASGDVNLNGTVTADGRISGGSSAGGGAGGGILISCKKFSGGSTARLRADGKNGADWGGGTWYGGGGGGGRIAVWQKVTSPIRDMLLASQATPAKVTVSSTPFGTYLGTVSVTNGFGWGDASTNVNDEATVGSIVFLEQLPPSGTLLLIR